MRSSAWIWLFDGDDDGVLGRVHVEANDVLDLVDELRIGGALERAQAVGLQSMRFPQTLNGAQAHAHGFGMARPVQCVTSPGGSEQVSCRIRATTFKANGARPGLRVLSRSRPSTPSSA